MIGKGVIDERIMAILTLFAFTSTRAMALSSIRTCGKGSTWSKTRYITNQRNTYQKHFTSSSIHDNESKTTPLISDSKQQKRENAEEQLDWDKFEFGDSPKQDNRFSDTSKIIQHADDSTFGKIIETETKEDEKLKKELDQHNAALLALDPALVEKATSILKEYVKEERVQRLEEVLSQRTQNCRFLFENPGNPSNVWACLR